jgi:hypothetical protein
MQPISFKFGPYKFIDRSGNTRIYGILPDGRKTSEARLIMMNFLHTKNIPISIHVHHKDENTENNNLSNLELLLNVDHGKHHTPRDYSRFGFSSTGDRLEYQRAYMKDPVIHEKQLIWKRKYYHDKLKNDPLYVKKSRERVAAHHKIHRIKKEKSNEN